MKDKKRGGKREGAGRKPAPPTKAIYIRVPLCDYEKLLSKCKEIINTYYNEKTD